VPRDDWERYRVDLSCGRKKTRRFGETRKKRVKQPWGKRKEAVATKKRNKTEVPEKKIGELGKKNLLGAEATIGWRTNKRHAQNRSKP